MIKFICKCLLSLSAILASSEANESFCRPEAYVNLTGYVTKKINPKYISLTKNNIIYPFNSIKRVGNDTYGCPCMAQNCISICCFSGICPGYLNPNISIPVQKDEKLEHSNFYVVSLDPCPGTPKLILNTTNTKLKILKSGSLYYPNRRNSEYHKKIYNYSDYCLRQYENEVEYSAVICYNEVKIVEDKTFHIKIIFKIISVTFLLVTFFVYLTLKKYYGRFGYYLMHCVFLLSIFNIALVYQKILNAEFKKQVNQDIEPSLGILNQCILTGAWLLIFYANLLIVLLTKF